MVNYVFQLTQRKQRKQHKWSYTAVLHLTWPTNSTEYCAIILRGLGEINIEQNIDTILLTQYY